MNDMRKRNTLFVAMTIGLITIAMVLVFGTMWIGRSASQSTVQAVRSVSLLYLDELARRRKRVVEDMLNDCIKTIHMATSLMEERDLTDLEHLQEFQKRMKKLFKLEKFAFVDTKGMIYTSLGMQTDIDQYHFDYKTISEPDISVKQWESSDRRAIIAVPVNIKFQGETFVACFEEMNMDQMMAGISMISQKDNITFTNIYSPDGYALSSMILGGRAAEDDLFGALSHAMLAEGYSVEKMKQDFASQKTGHISFIYNGVKETMYYISIARTDWMLTYLIRENIISNEISSVYQKVIHRSVALSILNALILLGVFLYILKQNKEHTQLLLEKETTDAELRGKQAELGERIILQDKLVQQSQALSDALKAAEQANKAKTAFLSNMSHEIRTPMNAIIGLDNIALNDPETTPKIKDYLTKIRESAHHLFLAVATHP